MDSLSRAVGLKIKKGEHEVLGSPFFLLWLSGLSGLLLLRSQLRPARPLRCGNFPAGCCRHSSFSRVHRARLTLRGILRSQFCPPSLLRERNFSPRSEVPEAAYRHRGGIHLHERRFETSQSRPARETRRVVGLEDHLTSSQRATIRWLFNVPEGFGFSENVDAGY